MAARELRRENTRKKGVGSTGIIKTDG